MKKSFIITILALMVTAWGAMGAPDRPDEYLGLPGDNLNLYAVMKLFQESETLEAFERDLNSEDSRINNLDLNGDNMVDYISVSDYVDGDVHNIVLRVPLNQYESQDVAVFIVEELRGGEVRVQLIGDEALYGRNYIVEPIYAETPNPGYMGRQNVAVAGYTYYDIAAWPVIRYIYHPRYVVWRSSWRWGYYPVYWDPWRPHYWHFYHGYHYNWYTYYHSHYRPWKRVRWNRYDRFYSNNVRVYSPTVVVNINRGAYRDTYSRPDRRRAGEELYARTRPASRSDYSTATRRSSQSRSATRTETTRPVTRSQTRSATRTETTRPVTRSQTRSATRTETTRPVTRSQTRSATRTETTRPVTRSQSRSATRTETTRPVTRSQTRSATSTETTRPVTRSQTRSATRTETTRPVTRSQSRSATRTETTRPVTRSQTRSATRTQTTRPVTRSQTRSATRTETTRPVTRSQSRSATVKSRSSSKNSRAAVSRSTRVESKSSKAGRSNNSASKARNTRESRSSGKGRK